MLYTTEEYNKIINNAIDAAGIANVKVNGVPVGHISAESELQSKGALLLQPVVANQFISALYNQFIYRATAENYFTSPFDYFRERRDGVAFGSYEADVQPIFPVPYDMKAFDRILDFWETPTIVQYFAINRRDTFPQTITKAMLKDAFISYDELDNFMAKLILAPRKGNVVIETNAVKTLLNKNVAEGAILKRTYTAPSDADDWKALAAEIVGVASGMSAEPSTKYNSYANIAGAEGEAWTQSDKRDLVLIGTTDVLANLRTYVMAFAMHNEEIDFNFKFIELNDFNYATYDGETRKFGEAQESPLKLILCDGGFIKFEDNLDEELSNTNSMTMGVQRALQIQQTIGIRVYRNAVAWIDSTSDLVTNTMRINDDEPVKYLTDGSATVKVSLNGGTVPADGVAVTIKGTKGTIGGEQTSVTKAAINNYIVTTEDTPKSLENALKAIATGDTETLEFKLDATNTVDDGSHPQYYLTVVCTVNDSEFTIVAPAYIE